MWGRKDEATPSSASALRSRPETPAPVQPSWPAQPPPKAAEGVTGLVDRAGRTQAQIGKALKLKGEITGNEDLYIDGEVEGTVELKDNSLTVGPNGNVQADVTARSITVLGRLLGNVRAGERMEIRKTGSVEGDLVTASIIVEEGAVFRGSIDMLRPGHDTDAPPPGKKSVARAPESVSKAAAPSAGPDASDPQSSKARSRNS